MAKEPVVAPDVRPLVELPGARHRTHRPAGHHGRQPRRVAGFAAGRTRCDGPDRRDPQTRFDEDLVNPGPHVDGVDTMRRVVADWAPERVSAVTGIDEDRIRRLARELAGTE